jgi:uncharacterized protein (DUF58 family)
MRDQAADDGAPKIRREIVLTHAAIYLTLMASLVSLGGIALSLQEDIASRRWGAGLGQALFLAIVGFLIYGGLVYQLARLGHLRRLLAHQPASEEALHRCFHSRTVRCLRCVRCPAFNGLS